jgi:NADPH-dependent curcumin reductase CurA
MSINRQCLLAARPVGEPKPSDWQLVESSVPEPGEGEFVVEVTHISLDPAMRGWMSAAPSYVPPVEVGSVMRAITLGRVVASRHKLFSSGQPVSGLFGVQNYAISDGAGVHAITASDAIPLSAYMGVLGMTGMTAYFGLLDVGRVTEGDTVLVSGAAGAVGTVVGQIARIKGARVVGIAGGEEKCRLLVEELGFDAAIDYKAGDVPGQLRTHTPDHVDVFFDNVGGEILDQGLTRIGPKARVVICGAISQYNNTGPVVGPSNYLALLVARASMSGFIVMDYQKRYSEAIAEMSQWLQDGTLISVEDAVRGDLEEFPNTLRRLYAGENTGKLILELEH